MVEVAEFRRQDTLRRAVRCALATLAASSWAGAAHAQQPATAVEPTDLDEVVVTGSRIRGAIPVGSVVTTVSREEIDLTAPVSTTALVQRLPQVFNLGVSENSRGQSGGSGNITYGSAINLRGLGPFSTLTLLEGRRAVPQGTTGFAIDPSIIPTVAIGRVEVVADGASALYGSDAVAGVVNLLLRRDFEGVEASVRRGFGDAYREQQASVIGGTGWEGGNLMAAYEYSIRSNLGGLDRDFFRGDLTLQGGRDFRVVQCNPGNVVVGGVSHAIPSGGVTTATRSQLVPGTTNRCDNAQFQDLLPEQERHSFVTTFDHEFNDRFKVFADALWTRREFVNEVGNQAAALTVRNVNPYFVAPPGSAATSVTVNYAFGNQLPSNDTRGFSEAYQATVGVDIDVFGDWNLESSYTYGRDTERSTSEYGISNAALAAALARTDPATALNPFGTVPNNAAALDGLANQLFIAPGDTRFQGWELKFDGPLATLPGGELRAAIGYEGQLLTSVSGLITGTWAAPVRAINPEVRRTVNSGFAEILVPIFGEDNARPGLRRLVLDLAVRSDNYSDLTDGSTVNPKYGIDWAPLDNLQFRATYGESFRAPTFAQIYGNSSSLFVQNYSDPTRGGAITQGVALSGGNLELEPETASTYTFGVDYEPIDALTLHLTYFHIEYEKQITSYLSDLSLLNREAQFAGTGVIVRNPDLAFIANLVATKPVRGVLPNPVTLFVDGRTNNLGTTIASGYDLSANYEFEAGDASKIGLGLISTYFDTYEVAITPTADRLDQLNTIYNPLRFKARANVTWSKSGMMGGLFVNHFDSYSNNLVIPLQEVAGKTTVDVSLAYTFQTTGFAKGLKLALDVVNAFDEAPPFVNIAQSPNGGGGFDPTLNNPVGRIVGLKVAKKF